MIEMRRLSTKGRPRLRVAPGAAGRSAALRGISGYAAIHYDGDSSSEYELWAFGNERCVERLAVGCFDRALAEKDDVRALYNHDANCVLGRSAAGTLDLRCDKRGLHYQIDPPDTQLARDLMTSIGRGDINGSSFAFTVEDEVWQETKTGDNILIVREVRSVRLLDISPCTYPAYEGTTACAFRTEPLSGPASPRRAGARDAILARLRVLAISEAS
jgi:HK97 family phage prohead protease